jgi:hypothetical protein
MVTTLQLPALLRHVVAQVLMKNPARHQLLRHQLPKANIAMMQNITRDSYQDARYFFEAN